MSDDCPGVSNSLVDGYPCLRFGCFACCIETEMPLSSEDLNRIEKLGYKRVDFAMRIRGEMRLRNQGKNCIFLADGKCKIYTSRPEGCRLYPLVYDEETHKFVNDSLCPYGSHFKAKSEDKERLKHLIRKLGREASKK